MIDLRSDTVTKPTPAMRRAMFESEVGDDVYQEDPTVNRLEERAALVSGKEAALFVPTGTMGNTIAIKLLTEHGQEVVCDARSHLLDYELSMTAWFSGVTLRAVPTSDGILRWPTISRCVKPLGPHWAPTGCIEIENTHNMAGGRVYPQEVIDEICAEAHSRNVKVHMDGARVFNASAATGVPVSRIAAQCDTLMFCLSKGLGAPVGSILAGPKPLIDKGRLYRKRLGGGMRQAGILAAAALIALEETPARLAEDHDKARAFAHAVAGMPGIALDVAAVETNIVVFDVSASGKEAAAISRRLKESGILMNAISERQLRAVTHYDVSLGDCEQAVAVLRSILATP